MALPTFVFFGNFSVAPSYLSPINSSQIVVLLGLALAPPCSPMGCHLLPSRSHSCCLTDLPPRYTGPYRKDKIHKVADDKCWWCGRGRQQTHHRATGSVESSGPRSTPHGYMRSGRWFCGWMDPRSPLQALAIDPGSSDHQRSNVTHWKARHPPEARHDP